MKKRILSICVYSETDTLAKKLKEFCTPKYYSINITSSHSLDTANEHNYNIVIIEAIPDDSIFKLLCSNAYEGTLVVLCERKDSKPVLTPETENRLSDIWAAGLPDDKLRFRFNHIINFAETKAALWLTNLYLETTINTIPDLVWYKDIDGVHLNVNDAFCHATGKKKDEILGQDHAYIWDVAEEEYLRGKYICKETDNETILSRKATINDEIVKCKDGLHQFKTRKAPLFDKAGNIFGTLGIASDITSLNNMHAEMNMILGNMPYAILVSDLGGHIININRKFSEYFDTTEDDMIGKLYSLWESYQLPALMEAGNADNFNKTITWGSNDKVLQIIKEPIIDIFGHATGYLYIYLDVTMERSYQKRILHMANTDYLTNLYNRRYLYEFLKMNRPVSRISLMYIDLDNFKGINDTYGHKVGDDVLCLMAQILTGEFPEHYCFRLGGDEFMVALMDVFDEDELKECAERLLDNIDKRYNAIAQIPDITGSIGIVTDSNPDLSIDELIKRGDKALYRAKNNGRNCYCIWDESMEAF